MSTAQTIDFHGQELLVVADSTGKRWAALRPICEGIGISWDTQWRKLESDPKFSCCHMTTTGADGKNYRMFCIPVNQLNGWLFSINANRVKPEVREKLLTYQRECQEVLFQHFMPQGGTDSEVMGTLTRLSSEFAQLKGAVEELRSSTRNRLDRISEDLAAPIGSQRKAVDNLREWLQEELAELKKLVGHAADPVQKETKELIDRAHKRTGIPRINLIEIVRNGKGGAGLRPLDIERMLKSLKKF